MQSKSSPSTMASIAAYKITTGSRTISGNWFVSSIFSNFHSHTHWQRNTNAESRQIFKRFGKIPTVIIKAKDGKRDRQIAFYNNSDWKKQRNGFQIGPASVDLLRWSIKLRSRSKLGMPCCICKTSEQVEMHHVRHIRKTGGKKPAGINAILQMMNRKQIPVCTECHQKIHRGDYDGMRLSDLAYNPYESEKRRRFRESRMR